MTSFLRTGCLLLFTLIVLCCGTRQADAQGLLPYLNGPNNAGREFWFSFPANWDIPTSAQYYIRLYFSSAYYNVAIVRVGNGRVKTLVMQPNTITTMDLTPIEAQVFTRNDQAPVPPDQVYRDRAIHVVSLMPMIAYGVNRTTYTSDGMMMLPTNALGREYVVASYAAVIGVTQELPSQLMVVAPYDNTTVTIEQPMATPNHTAGETVTVTMNRGDVYSAMSLGYGGDLSGAVIRASKPVAVTAGQNCTYIPNQINYCCCDHLSEMLLPLHAWGRHYQAMPFQTRKKGDFFRVFAGANNTTVYVNGVKYVTLSQAGGTEGIGWFEYQALGKGLQEFTADKPIYVAQYNASQAWDNVPSDPFYLTLTPTEQYAKELLFTTPQADYPLNYVNLAVDSVTYRQVEISTDRGATWSTVWNRPGVGTASSFPTLVNGRRYMGVTLEIQPGVYMLRAPQPLAGYIYGYSAYDSYGWPIAATTRNLFGAPQGAPPITAPRIAHTTKCDGTIEATVTSSDQELAAAAISSIDIIGDSATNISREVSDYEAGAASATVQFRVLDPKLNAQAVIVAVDMQGNVVMDTVQYVYSPTVNGSATGRDFGMVHVGATETKTVTIKNTGATPMEITAITINGSAGAAYAIEGMPSLPFTLQPGEERDVMVKFTPTGDGTFSAQVRFLTGCGDVAADLSGSGHVVASVDKGETGRALSALQVLPNRTSGAVVNARLELARAGAVEITVVNAAGAVVLSPVAGATMSAGEHTVPVDVAGLAAGQYYCRVAYGGEVLVQPFTVTR